MTQQLIFDLMNFTFDGKIERVPAEGVSVSYDGKNAVIGADGEHTFARGCFLLASEIKKGRGPFEIHQTASFKDCGIMLDVSRNGVMKVEAVKKYLTYMAALGMNLFMLYTEDTYELKEYPYFGYLRGRYSEEELREIDDFAFSLGIEVVPCIQTLGHMAQYLKYDGITGDIRDTAAVLCANNEPTYVFIEECIKTMRRCFRSNRIHIGMDESPEIGRGKYMQKYGYRDRLEILKDHLAAVIDICKKYDFAPMMWSDLFYNFCSPTHSYRDVDTVVPKEMVPKDVDLVFWDYYSIEEDFFCKMLQNHKGICENTIFAGGLWTWFGFVPRTEMAFRNTIPSLRASIQTGVSTVLATMWADNGCEMNHFLALPLLPLFSEFCYRGEDCPMEDIYDVAMSLTGVDLDFLLMLSKAHGMPVDRPHRTFLNALLYGDAFFALPELGEEDAAYLPDVNAALARARELYAAGNEEERKMYEYYITVLEILRDKAELRFNLRNRYLAGDRAYLENVKDSLLPRVVENVNKLHRLFEAQWKAIYKPFGYEVMVARFGSTVYRMEYAIEVISDYLAGKREKIEMLDEEVLPYKEAALIRFYKNCITASDII